MSDSVLAINEKAAEEFFKKAQEAEVNGQDEKAIELYERSLAENPDHELSIFRLALLYDRRPKTPKPSSFTSGFAPPSRCMSML